MQRLSSITPMIYSSLAHVEILVSLPFCSVRTKRKAFLRRCRLSFVGERAQSSNPLTCTGHFRLRLNVIRSHSSMALVSNLHSVLDVRRHLALFLLLLTLLLRPTSPAVLPAQQSASLYTANDKVVILTGRNFTSTVYQSKTAWLIEFYASWCGHCQSYANVRSP